MRYVAIFGLAMLPALALAAPALNIDDIVGVYKNRFANGLVDGSNFTSENILEIVKISPTKAYVRTHLEFYNGHECEFAAVMKVEFDALIQRRKTEEGELCTQVLRFKGGQVTMEDENGACKADSCGMRGGYDGVIFDGKSRRPIHYMKKLLASREYADALKAGTP